MVTWMLVVCLVGLAAVMLTIVCAPMFRSAPADGVRFTAPLSTTAPATTVPLTDNAPATTTAAIADAASAGGKRQLRQAQDEVQAWRFDVVTRGYHVGQVDDYLDLLVRATPGQVIPSPRFDLAVRGYQCQQVDRHLEAFLAAAAKPAG